MDCMSIRVQLCHCSLENSGKNRVEQPAFMLLSPVHAYNPHENVPLHKMTESRCVESHTMYLALKFDLLHRMLLEEIMSFQFLKSSLVLTTN